jgi:hypothetical protein
MPTHSLPEHPDEILTRTPRDLPGGPFSLVERLRLELAGKSRVLLYLSSGPCAPAFQELPFESVILVDQHHRRHEFGSKVIQLALDNNAALRLLFTLGVKISCVLGLNDGCCEGGNYECSYHTGGLGRLMPIIEEGCLWLTDHHYPMWERTPWSMKPAEAPICFSHPEIWHYPAPPRARILQWNPLPTVEFHSGATAVRIVHDSVWSHLSTLDALVLPQRTAKSPGCQWYLHPDARSSGRRHIPTGLAGRPPYLALMGEYPTRSVLPLVRAARGQGARRMGVFPGFRGFSRQVVEELTESDLGDIESVDFFHLHRGDFAWSRKR